MRVLIVLDAFEEKKRKWKAGVVTNGQCELEIAHIDAKGELVVTIDDNICINERVFQKPTLLLISHYGVCHSDDPLKKVNVIKIVVNGEKLGRLLDLQWGIPTLDGAGGDPVVATVIEGVTMGRCRAGSIDCLIDCFYNKKDWARKYLEDLEKFYPPL